jgi:DnaJ-domain-containing protein 1
MTDLIHLKVNKDHIGLIEGTFYFLLPAILLLIAFLLIRRKELHWEKGIFPPNLRGTNRNKIKAYVIATAIMLQKDKVNLSEKWDFADEYLKYYFPGSYENKAYLYNDGFNRSVSLKSLAAWFIARTSAADQQRLIDYLYNVAIKDGELNEREYAMILMLGAEFKWDMKLLEEKLNAFREEEKRSRISQKVPDKRSACELILGVSANAGRDEIKKVYRTLAKRYHPDKFMLRSAAEREQAAAKFREIQEAYEYISQEL